ncbi:high mobility group nucleosome-binding domain-containing protein 5-like [Lytechinus variegatus]|uniref:high mobility group nucleosome-binding domain-containing protein 5-like n=1 Tax=Lytechinus variegatus TaxID=7654 RepID=UPI001BB15631|nr:high mobility group nucleosome-binding domain-containing protein 5-like [Lytechinus variegatus]
MEDEEVETRKLGLMAKEEEELKIAEMVEKLMEDNEVETGKVELMAKKEGEETVELKISEMTVVEWLETELMEEQELMEWEKMGQSGNVQIKVNMVKEVEELKAAEMNADEELEAKPVKEKVEAEKLTTQELKVGENAEEPNESEDEEMKKDEKTEAGEEELNEEVKIEDEGEIGVERRDMLADEILKANEEMKDDEEKMMAGRVVRVSVNTEMWMEKVKLEEEDEQKKIEKMEDTKINELEKVVPEFQDFKEETKMSGKDDNIKKESQRG